MGHIVLDESLHGLHTCIHPYIRREMIHTHVQTYIPASINSGYCLLNIITLAWPTYMHTCIHTQRERHTYIHTHLHQLIQDISRPAYIHTYIPASINSGYCLLNITTIAWPVYIHTYTERYIHTHIHMYKHTYLHQLIQDIVCSTSRPAYIHTYIPASINSGYCLLSITTCIHTYIHTYHSGYCLLNITTCIHTYIHTCIN
jgi:hypothetical protein